MYSSCNLRIRTVTANDLSIIMKDPVCFASSIDHKYNTTRKKRKKNVNRNRKPIADIVIWRRFGSPFLLETL